MKYVNKFFSQHNYYFFLTQNKNEFKSKYYAPKLMEF